MRPVLVLRIGVLHPNRLISTKGWESCHRRIGRRRVARSGRLLGGNGKNTDTASAGSFACYFLLLSHQLGDHYLCGVGWPNCRRMRRNLLGSEADTEVRFLQLLQHVDVFVVGTKGQ